jgi:hypothetical protein
MAIRDGAIRIGNAGRQRGSKQTPGFLPSGTGEFFRKRLIEFCGLALFGLAAAILLACLTFNAADPSFNRAAQGPALNLLGMAGAHGADLLLQSLGLATLMLPLVLAGWGWRLTRRHLLDHWWLRCCCRSRPPRWLRCRRRRVGRPATAWAASWASCSYRGPASPWRSIPGFSLPLRACSPSPALPMRSG